MNPPLDAVVLVVTESDRIICRDCWFEDAFRAPVDTLDAAVVCDLHGPGECEVCGASNGS